MLPEREIITLAFGNFSTLVAAQWANGTSLYDVHENTLYHECRNEDVLGSTCSDSRRARVPRLVLIDAPYASTFDEIEAWAHKYETDAESNDVGNPAYNTTGAPSSRSHRALQGHAAEHEEMRVATVAKSVQRHIYEQHGFGNNSGSDGADDDVESEHTPHMDEGDDVDAQRLSEDEQEENDEGCHRRNTPIADRRAQRRAGLKRKLFDEHNTTIPWWLYITTGLGPNSVTSMKPLQHVDAAGDVTALHSFGYGLAHLRDDGRSSDIESFNDSLRRNLESADLLQGLQCFSDGDGLFGGAAANVLEQFWDEAGSKTPVVHTTAFTRLPTCVTDPTRRAEIAFRERRMDEVALNQLLATVHLSRHPSAVYIPVPLSNWDTFFKGAPTAASPTEAPQWLHDDQATAQLLAAVIDTALYGLRDGSRTNGTTSKAPHCHMDEWCRVVRPIPSLRVAAAMGALPQPVSSSSELWEFLQANPLLPDAPLLDERMNPSKKGEAEDESSGKGRLEAKFFSLTHSMSTYSAAHPAGQVMGHAVSLRGAGCLPATVYPAREAMLRYALPLRTSSYMSLLTEVNYPISSSFPMELVIPDPAAATKALGGSTEDGANDGDALLRNALKCVDVGAHVLTTYATAPMLRGINVAAKAALRYKMERYCDAYVMERDDWREVLDEGLALFDDYNHAPPSDSEDSGDIEA